MKPQIQKKQDLVTELSDKLKGANSFFLTDFTGLSVKRMTELRARLRRAGVEYVVVKNTLAERALEGSDLQEVAEFFRGPTGVAIEQGDPASAAKILADFAREHDNRPALKAGVVDNRTISAEDIVRLSKLPPREQLLAELVGVFEAPMQQLASVLEAKLQEVVGLLEALRSERDAA
jgi:large subunit ribosomal protein L10